MAIDQGNRDGNVEQIDHDHRVHRCFGVARAPQDRGEDLQQDRKWNEQEDQVRVGECEVNHVACAPSTSIASRFTRRPRLKRPSEMRMDSPRK